MIVVTDTSVALNLCCLGLAAARNADAVLMDERAGHAAALGLGLRSIGILGILIQAKNTGLIPAVGPVVDKLELKAGFWITLSLRQQVLDRVLMGNHFHFLVGGETEKRLRSWR